MATLKPYLRYKYWEMYPRLQYKIIAMHNHFLLVRISIRTWFQESHNQETSNPARKFLVQVPTIPSLPLWILPPLKQDRVHDGSKWVLDHAIFHRFFPRCMLFEWVAHGLDEDYLVAIAYPALPINPPLWARVSQAKSDERECDEER